MRRRGATGEGLREPEVERLSITESLKQTLWSCISRSVWWTLLGFYCIGNGGVLQPHRVADGRKVFHRLPQRSPQPESLFSFDCIVCNRLSRRMYMNSASR